MNKKIVVLSSEFPPLPGGIGNHAFHLSDQLVQSGYDVAVCTDQRSSDLADDVAFDNEQSSDIHRIKRYTFSLWTYFQRIWVGFKLIFMRKPEIIISSGKFSLWTAAFLKCLFPKKQFIAVLHGSELFAGSGMSKSLTGWSLKRFDDLIAVSNFTKELALTVDSALSVKVINNGFVVQKEKKASDEIPLQGFPKLVTVGNVTFRKGQQNLIDSLPNIKEKFPDAHYHIVGLPTEKDAFERRAREKGVLDAVTFHGAVSNDDLFSIVDSCDVFVMLSDHLKNGDVEGFGIAVLEANAFGLPAIGSSNSGIADAIRDGFSGKLVHPHDTVAIVSALEVIMSDYESYSDQAQKWSKQFDWSIIIQKYLAVLNK